MPDMLPRRLDDIALAREMKRDGFHAAMMSKIVRKWLEDPFEHFDKV